MADRPLLQAVKLVASVTIALMFPAWLEALILGAVQGLTEFIPVSSSGHLVLVPYLAGWERSSLAFDVVLHLGTLVAVLLYFRVELTAIVRGILRLDRSEQGQIYRRVGLFIVPASIPIAVVGLLLKDQVEGVFASPLAAAGLLLVTSALLFALEWVRSTRIERAAAMGSTSEESTGNVGHGWTGDWRGAAALTVAGPATDIEVPIGIDDEDPLGQTLAQLTLRQAMLAGVLQCLAILPGVSRSGATISAGVFAGLTREAATRFSFLLVIPALVGASILSLGDLGSRTESMTEFGLGAAAAFVSGYVAIRYLVELVARERLTGFAYYCIAASALAFVGYAMIGPPAAV